MKHTLRFLTLTAVFATFFTVTAARPAAAACTVASFTGPGRFSFNLIVGHSFTLFEDGVAVFSGVADVSSLSLLLPGQTFVVVDNSADCNGGGTFFNPGDGRVEPQPGDRVVVYCNTSANLPTLDVWGVTDDSQGHELYQFSFANLRRGGAKGIWKRVEPLGSVFASVDANNQFVVQWFGGPAGATGSKDFAKSFTCDFKR